jgi:tellurite resistance protein TerA
MDLKKKGEEAFVSVKQLMVSMKWTTAADFDLAALYEGKDGKIGLVYFSELGDLNAFPFLQLSGDEGVGDKGGENEETMRITKLDDLKYVWLLCWDYGAVDKGKPARFKDSDIQVTISDDSGKSQNVTLDTGDTGNVTNIATIDNSGAMGPKIVNASKTTVWKSFPSKTEMILNWVKG